jgi:two-component system capsular synthesis response regulator RcsB
MSNLVPSLRIVVADDHPVVLDAVSDAFEKEMPRFRVVATAQSGSELLAVLKQVPCDLVVTDFTMKQNPTDEDGLRMIDRIKRLYPNLPVVVFTMLTNGGILHRMIQMGVAGIVGKDESMSVLVQTCVRAHSEKESVLSAGIAARLAREGTTIETFRETQPLSPRELEVVRLYALGLSVTDIARRLNRSVPTVATQKRAAMRKLHVDTNADLVRFAADLGLS